MHGARLSKSVLQELGWRWQAGPEVVLKVQHGDMRGLMDSDVRNLGRLAAFVRDAMPFDVVPVRARLGALGPSLREKLHLICLLHCHISRDKRSLASPVMKPPGY